MLGDSADIDVVGFKLGVQYGDLWGHRGMTHSLLFAAPLGLAAAARFKLRLEGDGRRLAATLMLVAASHGILDAFTNGGLGVAFFAPFDRTRYFFPWTPIEVSPIGAARFFTARGLAVLLSEMKWIWLPSLVGGAVIRLPARRLDER